MTSKTLTDPDGDSIEIWKHQSGMLYIAVQQDDKNASVGPFDSEALRSALDEVAPPAVAPALDPSDPDVIEQAADRARIAYRYLRETPWEALNVEGRNRWADAVRAALTPAPERDPKVDELKQAIEVHWDDDDPGEIARYLIAQGWTRVGGGEDPTPATSTVPRSGMCRDDR